MNGIWPKPGRVVTLNPKVVADHKMGIVRRTQLTRQLERTATLHYLRARPL